MVRHVLLMVGLVFVVTPQLWAAESPAKFYDELFGNEARQVKGTRDRADDGAFAKKLFTTAKGIESDQVNLQLYLLDKAYDFAKRDASAFQTAVSIAKLTGELDAKRAEESKRRVIASYRLAYARVRGDEREAVGIAYVAELMRYADEAKAERDTKEATLLLRQALAIAAQNKMDVAAGLRDRLATLREQAQTQTKIEKLESQLLMDATNTAAARELALLYVAAMGSPKEALPYAKRSGDNTLMQRVTDATQGVPSWNASTSLAMAKWYETVADDCPKYARDDMLAQSLGAYERFLALHRVQDADGVRATLRIKQLKDDLRDRVVASKPVVPATNPGTGPTKPLSNEDQVPVEAESFKVDRSIVLDQTKVPYTIKSYNCPGPRATITIKPGVEINGGTFHLKRSGHVVIEGDPKKPIILRNVHFRQDLGASFRAKYAVFENCSFHKNGAWFVGNGYSSKWTFENCIIHEASFPRHFSRTDYGFRMTHCSFTFTKFPTVQSPYRGGWQKVDNCNFIGCEVPPSVAWSTRQSNFFACTFSGGQKYNAQQAITMQSHIGRFKGASPASAWTTPEGTMPAPKLDAAKSPHDVFAFPVRLSIAPVRKDRSIASFLFE